MALFQIAIVAGCTVLAGCAGRPIDTSHFEPIFKRDYPAAERLDTMRTASTAPRPRAGEPHVVRVEQLPAATVATIPPPPVRVAPPASQPVRVVVREASTINVVRPVQDPYRLDPDGKTILPPSRKLEIIDLKPINAALAEE